MSHDDDHLCDDGDCPLETGRPTMEHLEAWDERLQERKASAATASKGEENPTPQRQVEGTPSGETLARVRAKVGDWDNLLHAVGVTKEEAEALLWLIRAPDGEYISVKVLLDRLEELRRLQPHLERVIAACEKDEARAEIQELCQTRDKLQGVVDGLRDGPAVCQVCEMDADMEHHQSPSAKGYHPFQAAP